MSKTTKITIFHNARCSKSRCAVDLLKKKKVELEVVEYLKEVPTREEIKKLLAKLHLKPFDIIRTKEPLYKKKFDGLKFTDAEWIKVMTENPILIQRPIVVKGHKAIIARPVELINDLL